MSETIAGFALIAIALAIHWVTVRENRLHRLAMVADLEQSERDALAGMADRFQTIDLLVAQRDEARWYARHYEAAYRTVAKQHSLPTSRNKVIDAWPEVKAPQ